MKALLSRKNVWDRAPPTIKNLVGAASILAPLELFLGKTFRKTFRFLRDSQWWSHDQIAAYQVGMLQNRLQYFHLKSPACRRHFKEAGFDPNSDSDMAQFSELPFTDKSFLRSNVEDILTTQISSKNVDFISTSGTSGQPLEFYQSAGRSAIEYAYILSGWGRAGYSLGMTQAIFRGRRIQPNARGEYHEVDPLLRHHYFSSFHLDGDYIDFCLRQIQKTAGCYLHAYPSTASTIAKHIQRTGSDPPASIRGVLLESEIVYPQQRKLIEDAFRVRAFSSYGHTEKIIAAANCEETDDYHVWPTYGYFELIDDEGQVITERGKSGEIVGTNFIDLVTPFVRYRTGDMAEYVADRCLSCGRNHVVIREIRGHRVQESLIKKDGTAIPWAAVNMHDDTFSNVMQFQFLQQEPGKAILKLKVTETFSHRDRLRLISRLQDKLGAQFDVEVQLVDEIPKTRTGKGVYVDQRLSTADPN